MKLSPEILSPGKPQTQRALLMSSNSPSSNVGNEMDGKLGKLSPEAITTSISKSGKLCKTKEKLQIRCIMNKNAQFLNQILEQSGRLLKTASHSRGGLTVKRLRRLAVRNYISVTRHHVAQR